ncbi:MAG: hypothetical protein O3B87_03490 [bacterium]|nr:hypothetical protein [bacterium]
MRQLSVFKMLAYRSIKLLIFYIPMLPFFFLRLIFLGKNNIILARLDKLLIAVIGEVWIFGRNKIDLREVYEVQRKRVAAGFTKTNLLFFLPGQWYTLSPLESALLILMAPKKISMLHKILLIPYVYYLLLFDESRDHLKANHGIACALALSSVFRSSPKISRYYYFRAISILRANSSYFFYDEGSTNYHIFVTSLLRNYYFLMRFTPAWFSGYEKISEQLLSSRDFFYFGDDDRSQWLFDYRYIVARPEQIGIANLIVDHKFKRSVLDRYFKIYKRSTAILLVCINGSGWGHAHYMIGSVLYFIDDTPCVRFQKNTYYTLDRTIRQRERLFSCNSPVESDVENSLALSFFKRMPEELVSILEYSDNRYQVSISGRGWRRDIDFSSDKLRVIDSKKNDRSLSSTCLLVSSRYVEYSNICNVKGKV